MSINDSWFWGIQKDIRMVTYDMCPNASNQHFWPFRKANACSSLESSWWMDDNCLLEWTTHFYPWNEALRSSWIDSDTICTSKVLKEDWSVVHRKINKVLKVKIWNQNNFILGRASCWDVSEWSWTYLQKVV